MPSTVIQISIGAVHGPVAHGDDPRPDCPVLIGFLQRRVQSEGRAEQGGAGDGGGGGGQAVASFPGAALGKASQGAGGEELSGCL